MNMRAIEKLSILDFEASSLSENSWPIEVGISRVEGDLVQTWSTLIQPDQEWDLSDWSSQSARVHQISMSSLQNAPAASRVAKDILTKSSDCVLVSDAPVFERRWLSRLLETAGFSSIPEIADFDAVSFALFDGLALDVLYEKLERTRVPHRAGPDSARLASGWLRAKNVNARSR